MNDPNPKPLQADEIEAMLRSARNNDAVGRADVVSNEPLGPGDVQHLRNTDLTDDLLADSVWPYDSVSADELLHRMEHQLAAAMADEVAEVETGSTTGGTVLPQHAFPPLSAPRPLGFPAGFVTGSAAGLPLSVIGNIELELTLELGRADLLIEDLLALREGSVVTLDKEAGDPIDILANGKLVARGEVILVEDKFCVRICEVIGASPPPPN